MKFFLLIFIIFFNSFCYSSAVNTEEFFKKEIKNELDNMFPNQNQKKDHFNPPSLKEEKSFFDAVLADIKETLIEAKEAGRQAFADAVDSQRIKFNDKMRTDTHLKGTVYEDAFDFFDSFVETDFEIELAKIEADQAAWDALSDFEQEEYHKEQRLAAEAVAQKWQEQKQEDIRIRKQVRANQDAKVGLAIELAKQAFYFNYAFGGIIAIIIFGFIRGAFQHIAAAFDANYHLKRAEQQQQQQPKKPNENLSNSGKYKEEMDKIIAKRNR